MTTQEQTLPPIPVSIETEMQNSYLDYAMSVIIGRALPDVRDGLKPVHRRVLYTMHEMGLDWNKPFKKSARIVGECFTKGALVHTETGLCPIEQIEVGQAVQLPNGTLTPVTGVFQNPPSRVLDVKLSNGLTLTVTLGQLFRVLNDDLTIGWEQAERLEGRLVLTTNYAALGESFAHPDADLSALAYIVGLFVAEGYLTDRGRSKRVGITMTDDEPLEFIIAYCEQHGISANWSEIQPKQPHFKVQHCVRFTGIEPVYDVCVETCQQKSVPLWILRDRRLFAPFLAGYMEGDGYFRASKNRREVVCASTSETLLTQIHAMLADSGIQTVLTREDFEGKTYGEGHLPRYNLLITGEQASRFCAMARPFLQTERKARNADTIASWTNRTWMTTFESLPGRPIFEELSKCHLGGGWYQDSTGKKFRAGIKYPNGLKIRYEKGLSAKYLSYRQIHEWGILAKLEALGSPLAARLKDVMSNYTVVTVEAVADRGVSVETYDIGIDDPSHEFLVQGCAVHNCMGKYHPHGDFAIYDTLVRMEQDFSLRYPLVDGQGNFGSVDGDPPAAMRYTEARRARISDELLSDIDKETVDFIPNYDESLLEPEVLPTKLPNMLVNGSAGIAVGMATNIPPHNLSEIVDGLIALIDNSNITIDELCQHVTGPDFPTGAIIYGRQGISDTYRTGRGHIQIRAKAFVEKEKRAEKERIIITEIPYQVNKAKLIEKIAELVREKKVEGISDLRDESDRDGMRIVIELKRDQYAEVILNQLYRQTQLQVTFGAIMLAIVDQRPRYLNLKEIMEYFLRHRRNVIVRRAQFLLAKAEARDHIVQGLLIALDNIDAVVSLIRASQTPQIARDGLMAQFGLSEEQARAILDMRLQRLTGLEREKLETEHKDLLAEIKYLRSLLDSPALVTGVIKDELLAVKAQYGDPRRTAIVDDSSEITLEDMIVEEDMMVMITHAGYIKRNPVTMYRSQMRRGKGVTGIVAKEDDFVEHLFVASTHDYILIFTDKGKVYWLKVYEIPEAGRQARGKPMINLIQVEPGEKVSAILPVQAFEPGKYIIMATQNGTVKKTELTEYSNPRSNGIIALNINEGDSLVSVALTDGRQDVFLSTHKGMAIRFSEEDVRPMGRTATGVRGISLDEDDFVIGMDIVHNDFTILTVTEKGFGKRSEVEDYRRQGRGGKGLINIKCTPKRGNVVGMLQVSQQDDILLVTASGKVIRMNVSNVKVIGRNTQGVALQWLSDDDKVVGVARVLESDEEDEQEIAE